MSVSTRLDRRQLQDLCATVCKHGELPRAGSRVVGLCRRVEPAVMALRHNTTQQLLAEYFDVPQPTACRIHQRLHQP